MGLILCNSPNVTHPLYVEELDLHIYSSEELSYIIFEYPLLILDNFVNSRFLDFINNELGFSLELSSFDKISNLLTSEDELIICFLEKARFFNRADISKFKAVILNYRSLSSEEFLKKKGDFLYSQKKYGKAILCYSNSLKIAESKNEKLLLESLYNNLGSSYANLFETKKAYGNYIKAYGISNNPDVLKHIYFIIKMNNTFDKNNEICNLISNTLKNKWDTEYENTIQKVKSSDKLVAVEMLHEKDAALRKQEIRNYLINWKREYRNMI